MTEMRVVTSADTRVAVVCGALEAILAAKRKEGIRPVGISAREVSEHLSITLREVRNLLARAERAGMIRSITLRTYGSGRRNTRQTYKCRFYSLTQDLASDNR